MTDQPPVKVSPLIRGSRWTLLIVGIVYGAMKHNTLARREVGIRAEEQRLKKIKEDSIREEKEMASNRDIQMLVDIFLGPDKEE